MIHPLQKIMIIKLQVNQHDGNRGRKRYFTIKRYEEGTGSTISNLRTEEIQLPSKAKQYAPRVILIDRLASDTNLSNINPATDPILSLL